MTAIVSFKSYNTHAACDGMTWRGIIYSSAKLALKSHVMARRDSAIGWSYPTRIPPHQGSSHLCISEGTMSALCISSSSRLKFSRRKSNTIWGFSSIPLDWRNVETDLGHSSRFEFIVTHWIEIQFSSSSWATRFLEGPTLVFWAQSGTWQVALVKLTCYPRLRPLLK